MNVLEIGLAVLTIVIMILFIPVWDWFKYRQKIDEECRHPNFLKYKKEVITAYVEQFKGNEQGIRHWSTIKDAEIHPYYSMMVRPSMLTVVQRLAGY